MPVGEQTDQQRIDQVALADDYLAHFGAQRIDEDRFAFDALVEFLDVDDFAHVYLFDSIPKSLRVCVSITGRSPILLQKYKFFPKTSSLPSAGVAPAVLSPGTAACCRWEAHRAESPAGKPPAGYRPGFEKYLPRAVP